MKVITKPLLVAVPPVVWASAQVGSLPGLGQVSIELPTRKMFPGVFAEKRRANGRTSCASAGRVQPRTSPRRRIDDARTARLVLGRPLIPLGWNVGPILRG